ncbi:MAG: Kelch repeat-containing protein, partial [Chitinophagales bacterium]
MAPSPRSKAVGFSIGSKGYIGTGSESGNDFWEFDPVTNIWTQKASYPGAGGYGSAGFSIGNKGYIGTGADNSSSTKDFWEYDPTNNVWTQKADFAGGPRVDAVGFSVGTKGYIGTGNTGNGKYPVMGAHKNDFWEYDPATDAWTQKGAFTGGVRSGATGISIGNKGYIGLGYAGLDPGSGILDSDFWQYDPPNDIWIRKANFPGGPRMGACGFSMGATGFIGTGTGNKSTPPAGLENKNDFYRYDTAADSWSGNIGFSGMVRENAVAFSIGSKGYVGTGEMNQIYSTYGPLLDFYEFDTTSSLWTQKANLGGGSRTAAVSFSIGGKGYVGTGYDGRTKKDFWVFDPSVNAWTQVADFGGGERESAFAFAIGNKGYVGSGDRSGEPDYKNDFWEYDPLSNVWTIKSSALMRDRVACFTIGNKGYCGLGDYRATFFYDFWQYDPATDIWTKKADFAGGGGGGIGFRIGSKGYFGLGNNSNNFWEYDPAADGWTRKADFGSGSEGIANGFSLGNLGYALSGGGNNGFWSYDPNADKWTQKSTFIGTFRRYAIAFSTATKGYIGFGISPTAGFQNDLYEYTPGTTVGISTSLDTNLFCSSTSIPVHFSANGPFNAGNSFTAQLSSPTGSFANPISIGSVVGTTSGTITSTIPNGNIYGTGF